MGGGFARQVLLFMRLLFSALLSLVRAQMAGAAASVMAAEMRASDAAGPGPGSLAAARTAAEAAAPSSLGLKSGAAGSAGELRGSQQQDRAPMTAPPKVTLSMPNGLRPLDLRHLGGGSPPGSLPHGPAPAAGPHSAPTSPLVRRVRLDALLSKSTGARLALQGTSWGRHLEQMSSVVKARRLRRRLEEGSPSPVDSPQVRSGDPPRCSSGRVQLEGRFLFPS